MKYLKAGILLIFFQIFLSAYHYGFHDSQPAPLTSVADTLLYDRQQKMLSMKLSSREWMQIESYYPGVYESGIEIEAFDGGLAAYSPYMRAQNTHTYFYDKPTGKFRLAGYWHEHVHCGWMDVDLIRERFSADWHLYSQFLPSDSITFYPRVEFSLYYDPIYLGGDEPDFMFMGYKLLESLEEKYYPPQTDTVKLIAIESIYDENEPEIPEKPYSRIYYVDNDGEKHCEALAADGWPNRDDMIEITSGYVFYHDTVNNCYVVEQAITAMKIIEPGAVSTFDITNTKNIILRDEAGWAEQTGELIGDGVMYFIITTTDNKIKRFMGRPGTLEVFYSDFENETFRNGNSLRYAINMEVYNKNGHRKTHLGNFLLGVTHDMDYLYYDKDQNPLR